MVLNILMAIYLFVLGITLCKVKKGWVAGRDKNMFVYHMNKDHGVDKRLE